MVPIGEKCRNLRWAVSLDLINYVSYDIDYKVGYFLNQNEMFLVQRQILDSLHD